MEKLFDGEYRLMEVLWESAPVNSTQLVTLCREQLGWTKSTTYTVLRKLCRKGAARNERAVVTPLLTREQVIRAQGEELAVPEAAGSGLPGTLGFCPGGVLVDGPHGRHGVRPFIPLAAPAHRRLCGLWF